MKICNNCGSQMPDEAVNCTVCGNLLQAGQIPQQQPNYQQPGYQQQPTQQPFQQPNYQQPYQQMGYQQQYYPANTATNKDTVAMVLGIISLVLGNILCGILGIVFGVQARNIIPENMPGRGKATAGLVCGILGCVRGALTLFCYVIPTVVSALENI
ncbi:MAG: DUF4190 domain-containing protein [Clostridia bacterium]|nr:DUF4190 domain-containing protein [Clostridia bacterium]